MLIYIKKTTVFEAEMKAYDCRCWQNKQYEQQKQNTDTTIVHIPYKQHQYYTYQMKQSSILMYILHIHVALLVGENAARLKKKTCLKDHGVGSDTHIQIRLHVGGYTIRICRIFWCWSGVTNVNRYYT